MTAARYVVSIAGQLLYFDAEKNPVEPFPDKAGDRGAAGASEAKPAVKLVPPDQHPAADPAWDEALKQFSDRDRASAEISDVIGNSPQ
ncbi:hypothetical protein VARIO8X_160064 [Burkholderiales bacterium 8X]|nr:hypothetical protein VARIO8X_160064 [Burkholderiales bacterium 8X]